MSFEDFIKWYIELGKLKICWAKPVSDVELLREEEDIYIIRIRWIIRRRTKEAILAIIRNCNGVIEIIKRLSKYGNLTRILIIPEDSLIDLNTVNARSILYFWSTNANILRPNREVKLKVYYEWNENELSIFRNVQKQSWGFFIPPRTYDHIVVLGFLNDKPVAVAYLNIHNFNIDYGIHVIKSHWRKRIGTRLLAELLRLAKSMNSDTLSVVRVFRSLKGTSSDYRAREFYRANDPLVRMSVFRLI